MEDIDKVIPNEQRKNSEVGYKRPPKEHQFKPGHSGNPNGRPEGTVSLTQKIKERLLLLSPDQKRTALDWLADNIVQDALDSNNKMRALIWNYLDGMPHQTSELTVGIKPIPILGNVYLNDSDKEDKQIEEADQGSAGGNGSQQDDQHNPVVD